MKLKIHNILQSRTLKIIAIVSILLLALQTPFRRDKWSERIAAAQIEAYKKEAQWVDETFARMNRDERIGQLFNIRAHSNLGNDHVAQVEKMIQEYHVGGLTFFQGTPEKQAELTNRYQQIAGKIPLMIAMDAEWGLGMRMKETTISFPKQLTLGAIQDNRLLYDFGKEVAWQLRRLGVHVNFAPDVDVNNNPRNPVINYRSFGESPKNVAAKGYMYAKGMQDYGVLACAKHFPGHGDTDVDSHLDLPRIMHDSLRLDSIELYPFKVLAQHGVGSVMVAHLFVPAFDSRPNRPSTLSKNTVADLLKTKIGFNGLVFTDGLGMKGVTKNFQPGKLEVEALKAGNDVLLLPENVPAAAKEISAAMLNGSLDSVQVYNSVRRVLHTKYQLGITYFSPVKVENITSELNHEEALELKKKLAENALTLCRNKDGIVPFKILENKKFASLAIGSSQRTPFQTRLGKYTRFAHFNTGSAPAAGLSSQLKNYDYVVVGLHDMSNSASKNFGLTQAAITFLEELQRQTKVVLVVFGNPYSLKFFDNMPNIIVAYEDEAVYQEAAAEGLFGALKMSGKLPVTASKVARFGDGEETAYLQRLGYDSPQSVGLNADTLLLIDKIAQEAINAKATPGCVVLVAKSNKVVYNKAFGYHDYTNSHPTSTDDIFDLASVTKIAATTISLMRLQDEGKFNTEGSLGDYLSMAKGSNKENLPIKDMLAHQAGLTAWIPFYKETLKVDKRKRTYPDPNIYKKTPSADCSLCVADDMYMKNDYAKQVWQQILDSDLRGNTNYKYSDLGFYLFSKVVEQQSGKPIDQYTQETFYQPLGMASTTFKPLEKFDKSSIVPTENDSYFRNQKIQGHVHDMGAAMLDGVSGHAGLFSTANDLAIYGQMLLNKGSYGGKQYLRPETVALFTTRRAGSTRRGLGFDMKELDPGKSQNLAPSAADATFGHLGFTGICIWIDPQNDLSYVFLSNRTYPSMNNNRLNSLDIRPRIQEVVYHALNPVM
jgi:beta-N-acetylhexosaminidase